ncbi:MAG: pyridoxine 5'-phosphate synthase [Deltaproteobacteria bacterium RBG_19FT_COMBO_52_11]|nr:MAG: pyridoxine 5'-phosphate synthase [Deltaproteobacteria bacterium RBG_19FT_COMBO_52_11]
MSRLAVNVDHVATLRQARRGKQPDPVAAAVMAEIAGADGIIVHLREDRRHIQDRDLELMRQVVKTRLNLEMANTEEILQIALGVKPDLVTFVPERRQELTTEGGLDVRANQKALKKSIAKLKKAGIQVSLFIDADGPQVKASKRVGADFIEIHTGKYCDEPDEENRRKELQRIARAVQQARRLGLRVNVGHGLDYQNVLPFMAIPGIEEYSIGHSIISRAVLVGLDRAVREMKERIK